MVRNAKPESAAIAAKILIWPHSPAHRGVCNPAPPQFLCEVCLFCTRERPLRSVSYHFLHSRSGVTMKKIALATAAILAILSVAGCAQVGKGKAPPPVVTKG